MLLSERQPVNDQKFKLDCVKDKSVKFWRDVTALQLLLPPEILLYTLNFGSEKLVGSWACV